MSIQDMLILTRYYGLTICDIRKLTVGQGRLMLRIAR